MEPQLAVGLAWDKIPRYAHYSMEPKLDGIRCVAYKDNRGRVTLTSRGSKDLTEKVPHIVRYLEEGNMFTDSWYDGELGYNLEPLHCRQWPPILDFNRTTRVLGSSPHVALAKQMNDHEHWDRIQFHVFDCPDLTEMHHQSYKTRRNILVSIFNTFSFDISPVVLVPSMDAFDEEWYNDYVERGGEGVMLKNPDALYDPGGRHANNWYKVKKFDTVDGMIVDIREGKGKYEDMCGALVIAWQKNPGDVVLSRFQCAGMDDDWRREFWRNFGDYELKWIEVKHFGFTAGTPRFPQFLRMRPDLD